MVIVSACLLGECTRYDGRARFNREVAAIARRLGAVAVCPEQMGGLPTPRPPAYIVEGDGADVIEGRSRVVNCQGRDVTAEYVAGAEAVLAIAKRHAIRDAYITEGSPACGVTEIRRNGRPVPGCGVCAAMLRRAGVRLHGVR